MNIGTKLAGWVETWPEGKLKNFVKKALRMDVDACCILAGTPVITDRGLQPLEQIRKRRIALDEFAGDHAASTVSGGAVTGRWVSAGELRVGDVLVTRDGGTAVVDSVQRAVATEDIYNFHVAKLHSYTVGRQTIWVHNTSGNPCPPAKPLTNRPHGGPAHDAAIDDYVNDLPPNAIDVRKDQTQVNAAGQKVSDYRPDAQWTDSNGVRHYYEVSSTTSRADPSRLRPNDPNAIIEVLDLETGITTIYKP